MAPSESANDPEGVRNAPHLPVLVDEVVELLQVRPGMVVVDGTFGAGGHARALAGALAGEGTYIAIDRDPSAAAEVERFRAAHPTLEVRYIHDVFPAAMRDLAVAGVSAHAVILDLGVSSMQLDQGERGFAYSYDAPLDMRMDQTRGQTAADILATASHGELARILREYGDERFAGRIASAIVARRDAAPITRTGELAELVRAAIPAAARRTGGHPAKRTFQALRIAVNDELRHVEQGLDAALELLAPGGRLAVISFQSLEDRIVKRRFRDWLGRCTCPPGLPVCACGAHASVEVLTRKALRPSEAELAHNPRARPSRLRAVRKLEVGEAA